MSEELLKETSAQSSSSTDDLIIEPGINANVQIGRLGHHLRLKTDLIGCLPGKAVLITMPTDHSGEVQCYRRDTITLRFFHGREIHGFKSDVIAVAETPYNHLHLSYPAQIEKVQIRREPRVDTDLKATIQLPGSSDKIECRVADISTQGARLCLKHHSLQPEEQLTPEFEIRLGDKHESISITTEVRSAHPAQA